MEVGVMALAVGVALALVAPPTAAFNLDPRASHVLQEPRSSARRRESYFGYSVALYSSGSEAMALVGAPRANTTLWEWSPDEIPEPGALYVCPLSDAAVVECRQILVDDSGNSYVEPVTGQPYQNRFNHCWLGVTLDLKRVDNTDFVATCGHRWINQFYARNDDFFMNGICFWAYISDLLDSGFSHTSWKKLLPLLDPSKQRIYDEFTGDVYYYYQIGQTGTSAHILNDGSGLLMGTPGVKNWAGTVALMRKEGDPGIIDSRGFHSDVYTSTDVFPPNMQSQASDYFGYSVTSGRFWGDEDSFVAGAPKAYPSGKVYIFKTRRNQQTEVEWTGVGDRMGSGYGTVVAAGDVDGDGLSELFVGAPLSPQRTSSRGGNVEAPDAGEVVVYSRSGSSAFVASVVLRGDRRPRGARFGSAVSVLGDLDRDGFQDVAVGAPYEEDGRGAVYVYRGSPGGLAPRASQKILASDVDAGLRAFGIAFSKGVDVDSNGYVDLAVGAYGGEGKVAVLRSRPPVLVAGRVAGGVADLTEAGVPFGAAVCVNYTGLGVQLETTFEMELRVDEGRSRPRALILETAAGEVHFEEDVHLGRDFCKSFSLIVQEEIHDLEQPLHLTFYYHSRDFDPESPWCKTCGILAPGSTSSARTSIPFALGCGSDGVCSPMLELQAHWTSGPTGGRYTVGSNKELVLQVMVKAKKEPAYLGKVFVDLPQGLTAKSFPYSCSFGTTRRVTCDLISPLSEREETLTLVLQENSQLQDQEMVKVEVSVQARGAESQRVETQLLLNQEVELVLTAYTEDDLLYYNKSSLTPQVLSDVTIQVENRGITKVTEVTVEILVPLAYSPPDEDLNITFGSIDQVSVVPDTGINVCRVGGLEVIPGGMGDVMDRPPEGIPLVATCAVRGMLCGRFFCNLGDLNRNPWISLKTNYNLTYLIGKYGRGSTLSIYFWSAITASTAIGATNPKAGVWLSLVPEEWQHPTLVSKDAPVWAYVVGVLVGLILLSIIVVVLFKFGFFTRKRPAGGGGEGEGGEGGAEGSPSGERNLEEGEQIDSQDGLPPPPESHDPLLQEGAGLPIDVK